MSDSAGITAVAMHQCGACGQVTNNHATWCCYSSAPASTFDISWMAEAICGGLEMFPDRDVVEVRAAKDTCKACPVRRNCAEYAVEARMDHGIWGGFTPQERKDIRADISVGRITLEEALA